MVIGEDTAAVLYASSESCWSWEEGVWRWKGPPPHCLHPGALLPFVTVHNISLAGRANNGEVEGKRDSGDPPPLHREDQISSRQSQKSRAIAGWLGRNVSFIKHSAAVWQFFGVWIIYAQLQGWDNPTKLIWQIQSCGTFYTISKRQKKKKVLHFIYYLYKFYVQFFSFVF